ncbi:hypothetical protein [Clostridium botulinum]|uniref:hypothetical protein n=1 Tax=Clostridium botulinum TaxID=1491 RepID=UPI000382A449|nr:hypothetical protein [Clostridium botulinum]
MIITNATKKVTKKEYVEINHDKQGYVVTITNDKVSHIGKKIKDKTNYFGYRLEKLPTNSIKNVFGITKSELEMGIKLEYEIYQEIYSMIDMYEIPSELNIGVYKNGNTLYLEYQLQDEEKEIQEIRNINIYSLEIEQVIQKLNNYGVYAFEMDKPEIKEIIDTTIPVRAMPF